MSWRNRWERATRAAGLLVLLALGGSGCHLLPVGRVNPALDPRSLGRREGAPRGEAGAVAMKSTAKSADVASPTPSAAAQVPAVATAMSVPLPKLPLQPMTDREVLAAATPPAETPLLDEALERARGRQDATLFVGRDGSELVQAAVNEVREASGPVRGSGFDPVALEELSAEQPGPRPDLILLPPPSATGIIEPLLGIATRFEENEPAASSLLQVPATNVAQAAEVTIPTDGAADRVPDRPKAATEASPDQDWFTELRRLHAMATQRAASSEPHDRSLWEMRAGLLAWLSGEEPRAATGAAPAIIDENQHPLWQVAFALLSEGALPGGAEKPEGEESSEMKTDLDLRAAAWAIESRMPLRVSSLELCQKIRSFGNYDVADASQVTPGQTLTLYCEMEGISFEPAPEQAGFQSKLSSTLEVRKPDSGQVVWSLDLGSVVDQCRKRRRDYYVNYRVALPGAATLPPGEYRLALRQRDELTQTVAEREVSIKVVETASPGQSARAENNK